MTILVTGATGTVGRHLVEGLHAAGHRVRALSRSPERAALPEGVEVVAGDLTDPGGLSAAFSDVTAVHFIGFDGADWSPLARGRELADLAARGGARRVTLLKGDPGRTDFEDALMAAAETGGAFALTRLAPVEFMANALEWAGSVREEGVVREAFPEARSAMVHEADIAAVAAAALTAEGHGGQEYWLTGPEALTAPGKVRTIAGVLGREVAYVELSREEIVARWRQEGYAESDIAFFLAMRTDPPPAGYTVRPTVERVTGRPPRTFAAWVAEHAAAFTPGQDAGE
ncbi:NmrA family NAD(P)-binding protein [Streptomyces marincola]|uniref:NmrA family NAD(P)-binding protein n=1 Tax=Streptomyces marincola TaxID=2878388 RepID=UPI001CF39794|nr:NAD(P)H-binding protein [Streptomyces marincola]UCM90916.1 NAD(P)H-binding protein [Streptomyces marincola]